eukprot:SAG11_NODE_1507_length_4776_cov_55.272611_4_plen_244_part_00
MRMPQLVLCVVFLASCGCGVVEGQTVLTGLDTNSLRDEGGGEQLYRVLERIDGSCGRVTVTDLCAGGMLTDCNGMAIQYKTSGRDQFTGSYGQIDEGNRGNKDADPLLRAICGNTVATNLCPIKCGGGAAAGVGSGGPGEDDVPAVTKKPPNDSCPYAHDGECDEPMYCGDGTDCSDCGNCATQEVDDTCRYALDGECDEPRYCALETDCTDCDYCGGHRRLSEERVVLKMDDEATLGMESDT